MPQDKISSKEVILHSLDYIRERVLNDDCTTEEFRAAERFAESTLNLQGTVKEFAEFFDVPESYVRNAISRNVAEKPVRRVYYRFMPLLKRIPANC